MFTWCLRGLGWRRGGGRERLPINGLMISRRPGAAELANKRGIKTEDRDALREPMKASRAVKHPRRAAYSLKDSELLEGFLFIGNWRVGTGV